MLLAGVYCKGNLEWGDAISSSLKEIEAQSPTPENLIIEPQYLHQDFSLDFDGIMSGK